MEDKICQRTSSCSETCADLKALGSIFNVDYNFTGLHFGSLKYCIVGWTTKNTARKKKNKSVYGMANMMSKEYLCSGICEGTSEVEG
jgi:hypothetical protein